MASSAIQFRLWWKKRDKPVFRIIVAVVLSLAFHLLLLTLDFGEYGEGMPGLALPTGDRHARAADLHIALAPQPGSPTSAAAPESTNVPPPNSTDSTQSVSHVDAFELVPRAVVSDVAPVVPVLQPVVRPVVRSNRIPPKLLTSSSENPEFKVAESDQAIVESPAPEEAKPVVPPVVAQESAVINAAPAEVIQPDNHETEQLEKLAQEKRELERLEAAKQEAARQEAANLEAAQQEKIRQQQEDADLAAAAKLAKAQEQDRQKKLADEKRLADIQAEKDLEALRQAQIAAHQAEQARQDELNRQQAALKAQAQADREEAQRALLAERAAQEQRKLAEAIRAEQLKQEQIRLEQIKQEQLKQEQIKQEQLARDLVEKKRQEQEQLKRHQEQLEQQQRELARQIEANRVEAQAKKTPTPVNQNNDLDDILGASSGARSGSQSSANVGAGNASMDKMLSGHSGDYDRNGDVIKSSSGSTIPIPNLTGSTEAASGVRRSIFGSKNGDVDLNLYISGWRQKIENNGRLNYSQSAKDKVFNDPIVVVSIRSDGSIENILILRSSGRKEIDDAVRRIVTVNAPYSAFPLNLSRKYDVIDIRQVWRFDQLLHVTDEFR